MIAQVTEFKLPQLGNSVSTYGTKAVQKTEHFDWIGSRAPVGAKDAGVSLVSTSAAMVDTLVIGRKQRTIMRWLRGRFRLESITFLEFGKPSSQTRRQCLCPSAVVPNRRVSESSLAVVAVCLINDSV